MDSDIPVPSDVPMPQTAQTVLIVAMTMMAVLSLGYAIYASIRRRDLVHIWLLLGAGLAIPYEALGDNLVHVYYTERGQISWITTFGHSIPAFIGILYFWYLPIYGYLMIHRAGTGVSARRFWLEWSGFLSFAIFFEMLVTSVGGPTWIYYGPQAFKLGDVPVLTPFTYVSFMVAIAGAFCALQRLLPRGRQWLIVPAVPMVMAGSHAMTSLPLAVALHSGTTNTAYIAIGAIGTALFAVVLAYVVSLGVRTPWARGTAPSATEADVSDRSQAILDSLGSR
ncbi:hypothetical protein [Mycobacterium sp.]|uniref:hypothetical protein n=1 Tax=Mycobacterium sp. TaxID=1785 RepID=UPI003BAED619